jgi:hypothetical protein
LIPTSENLATVIFDILQRSLSAAHLHKVRLEETSMNVFEYAGGAEILPKPPRPWANRCEED